MNVALINGPSEDGSLFVREGRCTQKAGMWATQWPPVTLAYLAAVTRREEHRPVVFDCPAASISPSRLLSALSSLQPELCVFAISTPSFTGDMRLIEAVKRALPNTGTAVLGVHATARDEEILAGYPFVDFVIRHEPEETFRNLLLGLADGSAFGKVSGLSYRDAKGARKNPDRPFIGDLDSLPFPAWDLVDPSNYRLPFRKNRFLILAPLRGCPYRCSFCTAGVYYGHRLRLRSVASVIEEIRRNRREFAVNDFFMWAETFTIDRDFTLELCKAMQEETPGIRWTCNSRTDTVDEELLDRMRAAGCWMISFGIESTDAAVLKKTKKNTGPTDPNASLQMARRAGMKTLGHFILGLPGDTPATITRTIKDALSMDLDLAQFYTAAPFVGSPLYEQARKDGTLGPVDFAGLSQTQASLELPGLSSRWVDRARRRAVLRFILRPGQMLRMIRLARWGVFRQLFREITRRIKNRKVGNRP